MTFYMADRTSWRYHLDSKCVGELGHIETEEKLFVIRVQQRSKSDEGCDSSSRISPAWEVREYRAGESFVWLGAKE